MKKLLIAALAGLSIAVPCQPGKPPKQEGRHCLPDRRDPLFRGIANGDIAKKRV